MFKKPGIFSGSVLSEGFRVLTLILCFQGANSEERVRVKKRVGFKFSIKIKTVTVGLYNLALS